MKEEEGGLSAKRIHGAKGKKTLHLCEMETKKKSNRFKMFKSVHKSKPNKIYGEKPAEVAMAGATWCSVRGEEKQ